MTDIRFFLLGVSVWPLLFYPAGLMIVAIIAHRKRKGVASVVMVFSMLGVIAARISCFRAPFDAGEEEVAMHFAFFEVTIWLLQFVYAGALVTYFLAAQKLSPVGSKQLRVSAK